MSALPLHSLHGGAPFWLIRDGLGPEPPPLDGDHRCDVLVVGAGVSGALVADRLTREGLDVIVIDARIPGIGSTAASTALLLYEIDVELQDLVEKIGTEAAVAAYRLSLRGLDLLEEVGHSIAADCGLASRQSLYLARHPWHRKSLRSEGETRRRHGFECETWSAETVRDRTSLVADEGLSTSRAASVDALRLTRALLARAKAGGARVYGRTSLTDLASSNRVQAITPGGVIDAQSVILATGYELPIGLDAPSVRIQTTFALATEPDPRSAAIEPFVVWESARPYCYLRVTDDHRILIGGADLPFRDPTARDAALPIRAKRLGRRLEQLLGGPAPPIAFTWAGVFASTSDGLPLIGRHPAFANVFVALAYGGNGITFSALAAEMLSQLVRREPCPAAPLFAPDRTAA